MPSQTKSRGSLPSPDRGAKTLANAIVTAGLSVGGPVRDRPRTDVKKLFELLVGYFSGQDKDRQQDERLAAHCEM